jgi:SAM-dependent methyltransferase
MTGVAGMDQRAAAEHYDRWPFPGVEHASREGLILLRRLAAWLETPAAPGARRPRVVDVGCGTGHTVVALARRLPGADFLGLDVSKRALTLARRHAREAGTANTRFVHTDVTAPGEFGRFDVVLCLGVLHHVPAAAEAFKNLAGLLAPGGRLVLWCYGRYGRAGHMLNQRFLRLLTGEQATPETRALLGRALLKDHGGRYAAGSGFYTPRGSGQAGLEWLLAHPSWLADQMFPPFERAVTLTEILGRFDAHGLALEEWLGVSDDPAQWSDQTVIREQLARLSRRDRLLAIECLLKPAYYFVVGRPGSVRT